MKRLLSALSLIVATAFAGTASATTWSPNGPILPTEITLSSTQLSVSQGLTLDCHFNGRVAIAPNGTSAEITSLAFSAGPGSSFLCPLISFPSIVPYSLPYSMACDTFVIPTDITIQNIMIDTATGSCAGDLTGKISQVTGAITFDNAILPCYTGCPTDCVIHGTVWTTPAMSCM